ncbi:AMP-binding protein [Nocardia australiensis]|uniref:AMP-binding protein n=1 Tax=Nocardia australiensis TaxID=2887191 RepID=UPI001D13A230|nr:AMP-binding protein [Nocardia australiensis]
MQTASTIPAILHRNAAQCPDAVAVADDSITLTHSQLLAAARRIAGAYLDRGVASGDRVGIWLPNSVEFIVSLLGAHLVGVVPVPLNTRYRGAEVRTILQRSRAKLVVLADGFLGTDYSTMLLEACDGDALDPAGALPALSTIVDTRSQGHHATLGWSEFLRGADRHAPSDITALIETVTPDSLSDILFTSGTTGIPKGVMSTHFQTTGVAAAWAHGAGLTPNDRYATVNPYFHAFGYKAGIIAALSAACTIYPVAKFEPTELLRLIDQEKITVLPGVPTMFLSLINHRDRAAYDLSSLRFSIAGAASVPPSLFRDMRDVLGIDTIAQAYGLTECVVATQSRPNENPEHMATTTGPAIPGIEICVVDNDGAELPVGDDGEVLLRGRYVMVGYFENPEATQAAIDNAGWLHTGDVGHIDEHGCLTITDRVKDMYIAGGFNVYPAEIESVLHEHPSVHDCAVIGIDDPRLGAVGKAWIVTNSSPANADTLIAWCRERLANYKVPREIEFVDDLPRNPSGKIAKRELRERTPHASAD